MSQKPMIGVTSDYRGSRKDVPAFSFVAAGYYDAISRSGGIPVILPPLTTIPTEHQDHDVEADVHLLLDHLDGLIFVGGPDLDPRRDGFMLHSSVRLMEPRRETYDRLLMRIAYERRIPLYGIGVGMQLLNLTLGGTLFLNIPEDLPQALRHRDPQDVNHRHALEAIPGTLIDAVYGDGEIRVNSMHHMAIDDLGDGLRASARCPDGVIEAIEYEGHDWFALGTQFHPEAESATAVDIGIFEQFVEQINSFQRGLRVAAAA